jgi:leucyl/phenylalanyl-tRNA--protein transferase
MVDIILPDILLNIYAQGLFPMAENAQALHIDFYRPEMRGQISIDDLHIPRSLKKFMRDTEYTITINQNFEDVIDGCATTDSTKKDRENTWINPVIRDSFIAAHKAGYAHSVEYRLDGELMGGLYGLSVGKIFCGESMFSRAPNASKTALVHLCARLYESGYRVLDTQYTNPHLEQFGVYEVSGESYEDMLKEYAFVPADFILEGRDEAAILRSYFRARQSRRSQA